MQGYCYYAAVLWYEEPLRVEGPESDSKCTNTVFVVIAFGIW